MAHEPQLVPNFTLVIQLLIFLGCYASLRLLVFGPYLDLIKKREEKTVGLKERAAQEKERAEKLQTQYEEFMKAERKKLAAWVETERQRISEKERAIVGEARSAVGAQLLQVRDKIRADTEAAEEELAPLVSDYASQIATKMVGHSIKVSGATGKKSPKSEQVLHT